MSAFLSPKLRDVEVDLTLQASGGSTSTAVLVVRASKGPVGVPTLVTSQASYIEKFGKPLLTDRGGATALAFLAKSNSLWVVRYTDGTATFSDSRLFPLDLIVEIASGSNSSSGTMRVTVSYNDGSTEDITSSGTATWSSSDESVATVDVFGNVSAVSAGTAVITATYNGLSSSATFVATEPEILP